MCFKYWNFPANTDIIFQLSGVTT